MVNQIPTLLTSILLPLTETPSSHWGKKTSYKRPAPLLALLRFILSIVATGLLMMYKACQ